MVTVTRAPMFLPTYAVGRPDKNPMFFEKRVYQGSCGKVYPVPFIDKVFDEKRPRAYDAVTLENEYVRLVLLPELGGRIYIGQDKSNHDYDFFYRNDVIKPALVGLAGPWISGGVEFNWPQHHRPATFMPTDVEIEKSADGSITVWMSDHDPLQRMCGRHGICLHPASAVVELKAELTNRTPVTQTFLWWANVAARVHDGYESFFPTDVDYVADHAVRAISSFPQARNPYYGVDYRKRPGADNLAWYRNIPVPTSYMVCSTRYDFFGGYDHHANGGFVHVADRHLAPGKKQWTWGNAPFGYAWDRELTDSSGPYIELMAGVYTDNQPDFTYLQPFETKTFSQVWWPYQQAGTLQQANRLCGAHLADGTAAVVVSQAIPHAQITLRRGGRTVRRVTADLAPAKPWCAKCAADQIEVRDADGAQLLFYHAEKHVTKASDRRPQATEPAAPQAIASNDELYLTAEHLDQYRHPTRDPEAYLDEALRRDPEDSRCHTLYGKRLLARGLLDEAEAHLARAVARLTFRHPNPVTGEAHYYLGLVHFYKGELDAAYDAIAKAMWDGAWRASGEVMLARINGRLGRSAPKLPAFPPTNDPERRLDYAYDCLACGDRKAALAWLAQNRPHTMSACVRAFITGKPLGRHSFDYFFPSRLEDYLVLKSLYTTLSAPDTRHPAPGATLALLAYGLGNYYYSVRRHEEALAYWRQATRLAPEFPTAHRNLGMAWWNVHRQAKKALAEYLRAIACDPKDARLVAEYDQLREKCGVDAKRRFAFLDARRELVFSRDDATVQYVTLLNDLARYDEALRIMEQHRFHPWEGGEGKVLLQWARACARRGGETAKRAFDPPQNLGETFHLVLDDPELKCYKAMAFAAEGRKQAARTLFKEACRQAQRELAKEIKIDYFATSLPLLLIFDDDYSAAMRRHYEKIVNLAQSGLGVGQRHPSS